MGENFDYYDMAKARLEISKEFFDDAVSLYNEKRYKSSSNRAFYCIEKECLIS